MPSSEKEMDKLWKMKYLPQRDCVNHFKLEETKVMLMSKFKSSPPLPPLPTQLARGTGAWGQHYLSYKIFEIVILLVYLTFIAFVIDPRYHCWINQSILLYGIIHLKGDLVINQSLHSECCMPVTFNVGSFFKFLNMFNVFLPIGSHSFLERLNAWRSPNIPNEAHVLNQPSNLWRSSWPCSWWDSTQRIVCIHIIFFKLCSTVPITYKKLKKYLWKKILEEIIKFTTYEYMVLHYTW